jgi:hypothetical protein
MRLARICRRLDVANVIRGGGMAEGLVSRRMTCLAGETRPFEINIDAEHVAEQDIQSCKEVAKQAARRNEARHSQDTSP